jgi:beta-lactamase regulating signal transducer with metallopeptidase domain
MSLTPLFDHLWQSTVFAAVAGLLTLGLRKNRARVRHGLWLAASVKFLVPFSVLMMAGSQIHGRKAERVSESHWSTVVVEASEPFSVSTVLAPMVAAPPVNRLPAALLAIWACGFLGIAGSWWVRWRRLAAVVDAASPVELELPVPARISPGSGEPGVFGVVRPVLLLPEGIFERLTPEQLDAVIAHELYHVWHRDNLIAAVHMFMETVFWFHPLVWWIGKRLVEERERACDEGVLGAGSEPRVYAEAVLNVCKLYLESPLRCMSGITGANLKRRIEAIMTRRLVKDLSILGRAGLTMAGMSALAAPLLIGMIHLTIAEAQVSRVPMPLPEAIPAPRAVVEPPQQVPATPPTFTNRAMTAIYGEYGPPDQIEERNSDPGRPVQIWRYRFLKDYEGNAEFEFGTQSRFDAHVNWPVLRKFEANPGFARPDPTMLGVFDHERQSAGEPSRMPLLVMLPVQGTSIQPSVRLSPTEQLVYLALPLGTFRLVSPFVNPETAPGKIDLMAEVVEMSSSGVEGAMVAHFRDDVTLAASHETMTYRTSFILRPGSYQCRVLVRENGRGIMYPATIDFQLQ